MYAAFSKEGCGKSLLGTFTSRLDFTMLSSFASSALSFTAPSTLARGGVAASSRARPVFANENEMEPDGGWGVDNLMDMMDTADEVCARS